MKIEPKLINSQLTKTNMDIDRLKKAARGASPHDTRNWIDQILTLQKQRIILKRLKQLINFIK